MTTTEIEAFTTYLEFHLLALVEGAETHINNVNAIGQLYDNAYRILNDIEDTLHLQTCLSKQSC